MDQLNQDPHVDSVTDSDREAISMGRGRTDIAGDEEVEDRDEGSTTQAMAGPGVANLDWDPRDLLFEFNDQNLGVTGAPVVASTAVVAEVEDGMPELEDLNPEEPPQMDLPQIPGTNASLGMPPEGPVPNYSDVPLSGFRRLE